MPTLTNVGTAYDAIPASKELGFGLLNFTGITSVRFDVHVNKIGTGTQSWQLYNIDDAAEIAVINDNGAAGEKFLTTTVNVTAFNWTGIKRVRFRAKSTVAADDPVLFGACALGT
jgi:hypothetical protein